MIIVVSPPPSSLRHPETRQMHAYTRAVKVDAAVRRGIEIADRRVPAKHFDFERRTGRNNIIFIRLDFCPVPDSHDDIITST